MNGEVETPSSGVLQCLKNMDGQAEVETLRIAVRQLAESAIREGDLKPGGWELANPAEAVRAHRKIQESRPAEYSREVPLSGVATGHGFRLEVEGRADGVFDYGSRAVVEEIKTTRHDLSDDRIFDNAVHWAQARIYSYLLWSGRNLDRVETQLTYYQLDTQEERSVRRHWELRELQTFFEEIANRYLRLCREKLEWRELRDQSARSLEFPFPNFRAGQREVAVAVYQVVRDGEQLLVQAPTGIGKTVAAIFPSVKAMGEGHLRRMFFLTARGTGQQVALSAIEDLRGRGLRIRVLQLTARDKICFCDPAVCSAEDCEFARGFYDRLDEGITDLLQKELLSRETIEEVATRHRLCPFELSLELISYADCVICDYNYVFDPQVYLRRGDLDSQESVLYVVDEAHNLVDRAREMYSAALRKEDFLELRRQVRAVAKKLSRTLNRTNSWMVRRRQECEEQSGPTKLVEKPADLFPLLAQCLREAEQLLAGRPDLPEPIRESVAGFYYALAHFLRTGEAYDERYRTAYQVAGTDLLVTLYCVDPSSRLSEALKRARCAVFLSATLDPPDYFRSVLGCSETALQLRVPSPFPAENFCTLLMDRASTLYRKRGDTLQTVVQCLKAFVSRREGNYLLFFPSYEYLSMALQPYLGEAQDVDIIVQEPGMQEGDRADFLKRFTVNSGRTLVGFAVLGGIFGEAIDLVGDRLTGAAVVGVGLPGISVERDLIRDYYERKLKRGFEYAYCYPGMNRVLQAAGRVIRSETDRGVVLLIDERFRRHPYRRLLPREWRPVRVSGADELGVQLDAFWGISRQQ